MKMKIYLLLLLQLASYEIWAGSISGEISYSGSFTGTVYIAAFNSPTIDGDPVYMTTLSSPGSYAINDAADGTYYVVSIMSASVPQILFTDPYGFWGTLQNLTPVIISGNNNATGINITLVDGTSENPNPFAEFYAEPDLTIQLPTDTEPGTNPSLLHTGTSIWLYKHDSPGAASAKIFDINPETGALINTYFLSLESSANKISWIDKLVSRNGVLWGYGGYGDPSGSGGIEGVFRVDIASSTSSNQISIGSEFDNSNGLASDGSNFFISRSDSNGVGGIVKFNPDNVTVVPSELFISLQDRARYLSYGDNILWVGIDIVNMFNPVTSGYLGNIQLPGPAADVFFDNKFWAYDEVNNTIQVYYLSSVGVNEKNDLSLPIDFSLSQNYPNPFNPSTVIKYATGSTQFVSLKIYDVLGNEVALLVNEEKPAGSYEIEFNASQLSSGLYFYKLTSDNFSETKKMILMK
jgi:Secretion system C-terminal sorting domain